MPGDHTTVRDELILIFWAITRSGRPRTSAGSAGRRVCRCRLDATAPPRRPTVRCSRGSRRGTCGSSGQKASSAAPHEAVGEPAAQVAHVPVPRVQQHQVSVGAAVSPEYLGRAAHRLGQVGGEPLDVLRVLARVRENGWFSSGSARQRACSAAAKGMKDLLPARELIQRRSHGIDSRVQSDRREMGLLDVFAAGRRRPALSALLDAAAEAAQRDQGGDPHDDRHPVQHHLDRAGEVRPDELRDRGRRFRCRRPGAGRASTPRPPRPVPALPGW